MYVTLQLLIGVFDGVMMNRKMHRNLCLCMLTVN